MKSLIYLGLVTLCAGSTVPIEPHENNKIVCFWNSTSFEREGPGKFRFEDLTPALSLCTHLVYGYAGINADTQEVTPLRPKLDTIGQQFYRHVTQLKDSFPDLKIYLSIGGNADPSEKTHKYLTLTETAVARNKFIDSIVHLLSNYEFDGVDLAWQFPVVKVKKNRGKLGTFVHGIKKTFEFGNFKDKQEIEHREGFTVLVRDLKTRLRLKNKALTLTVLPHVNATVYYEPRLLAPNIDAVHLMSFDQKTPERNPKEADYTAPIYGSYGRIADDNIDFSVRYWYENGTPGSKIVVGIPTYGRTWKLTSKSQTVGLPPVVAEGPGAEGPMTRTPGILSYAEICPRFTETSVDKQLKRIGDRTKKYGSYSYMSYNSVTSADGIWIGHEEPDTAGNKASYVKAKGLGGIAIFDLSTDDFLGTCNGGKFPIVGAVKDRL